VSALVGLIMMGAIVASALHTAAQPDDPPPPVEAPAPPPTSHAETGAAWPR